MKKIFVIGCGRWGTFIAWYLDKIKMNVTLYGRQSSKRMQELMQSRKNEYLTLSDSTVLTNSYDGMLSSDIIIISVGSQSLRSVATDLKDLDIKDKTIVLCMKGIEISTKKRLSQVVCDIIDKSNKVAVWLGPGHVQEFCKGVPNCMVIDSEYTDTKEMLIDCFSSELIRFYYGNDLIGNEIGGAAKNVVGIAAGILEGLNLSSLKGALMARGTREIYRLIEAMGGCGESVYGLCHLGDYEATLFSSHSQNLSYGKSIAQKTEYCKLAEGYYTVKALVNLGKEHNVELPICKAIYKTLYEGKDAKEELLKLFDRSLKKEF